MASNANTVWHVSDALGPHRLVEFGVDTDVWSPHLLLGELFDGFYRSRSAPFESNAMDVLVKVDGVLASHHFFQSGPSFLTLRRHLSTNTC